MLNNNYEELHSVHTYQEFTRSYQVRYISEIRHMGLNTFRVLKDLDSWILQNKVEAQFTKWDNLWFKIQNNIKTQKEKELNLFTAEERTREAQEKLRDIENILIHTLDIDDTVDWESLKDKKEFKVSNPKYNLENELNQIPIPKEPAIKNPPEQPNINNYKPRFSFFDKLFKSQRKKKIDTAKSNYEKAINSWNEQVKEIEEYNSQLRNEYEKLLSNVMRQKEEIKKKYKALEEKWAQELDDYYKNQENHNKKIEDLKAKYFQKEPNSILQYCELVLNNSEYPESFPQDFDLDYNINNKLLLVDYFLPSPENIPKLFEVKYIAARKELKEYYISDKQFEKIYDTAIYNISIRTVHELFEADKIDAIDIIVFNGWVETTNKATGKKVNNCIVSMQVKKTEFIQIELANVDPKACFKSLKGVGSSKLIGITAIQPLVQLNKNDKRFIPSYSVANTLDDSYNLAIMDWEDFEQLIRELFEKEFCINGGEVKVTQASRDGGVDAVAFDPDPIKGGKIVIQAKRYTNTVGVSAVRDLYGTVMNEGATKGILVTTADYGSDAYEFAKNKPLTLLNGNNLLFLLEKHGYKAKINLLEAKKIQQESNV